MDNLQQLMQMGQQLQSKVSRMQEKLEQQTYTASAGGGMVTASVDGKGAIRKIRIEPSVVDPADVEMLEDLVMAAVSEAQAKAGNAYEEQMKEIAGGLPFPMRIPGIL